MSDYGIVETSPEVWAVIKARHHDKLKVFGSFSAPEGDYFGNPNEGKMFTSYGFDDGTVPIMEAETRWEISREEPSKRINEKNRYWLCFANREME